MRKGMLSKVPSAFKPTVVIVLVVICLAFIVNSQALAGTESGDINFAYATWVGSGYYKIGNQRAYILRGNFSWTLREHDQKNWGIDLLLPATIGYFDYSDLDDVSAITFVPGIQLIYPVKSNWWLKPYGQIGIGWDLSDDDSVLIGGAGIKSLALFPLASGVEVELGNNLTYADNSESDNSQVDNGFSMFEIGLNSRWPMDYILFDRQTYLNVFLVYTQFINELGFLNDDLVPEEIDRLFKIGISLQGRPDFSIWGFSFRGFGLDFTYGDDYSSIGLITGFPF